MSVTQEPWPTIEEARAQVQAEMDRTSQMTIDQIMAEWYAETKVETENEGAVVWDW